ncbi:hypothetical protein DB42_EF00080 [Neochlamydia sp. EPS4]|uniref:membrane protein insertion efficiency factor YidD n=1 Tax=Neochlamydia sp. EPS4 TaxID=1478175 RepID=UPI0005830A30|nr:membrane protein insertion efficiency factor YidD [Neochlamydia sp. EPS4]KIC76010.1 hypothetical protein DB42_EF00080 [Neochlamydia sp. EPS4]
MPIRIALNLFTLFPLVLISFCLRAEPWGKDADLAHIKPASLQNQPYYCTTPLMGPVAESLIGFHQTIITPIDGPRSNYLPSSSQYTLDAMRKYGFFVGFSMGCDRLMRENDDPWVYSKVTDQQGYLLKYNPVP